MASPMAFENRRAGVFRSARLLFLLALAGFPACGSGADTPQSGSDAGVRGTGGQFSQSSTGGKGSNGVNGAGGAIGSGGADRSGGSSGSGGGRVDATGGNGSGGSTSGAPGSGGNGAAGRAGAAGRNGASGSMGSGGATPSAPPSQPKVFSQCRFHFGTTDTQARNSAGIRAQADLFVPGWVGQSDTFNMGSICTAAKSGGALAGMMPTVVSYIIAFAARRDQGLQDCNVSGSTNLCKFGATYLRAHLEDRIIPLYGVYARGFAAACGASTPMLWLMEPDYYQYSVGGDANALTAAEAGQIMGRLVATVRQAMPNAVFSLDISPWMPNNGRDWYSNFNLADFSFINTSGGGTDADNTRIRAANNMTWAGVHQVTGQPILADTGYGAAGSPTGPDPKWDVVANLNARIADGVVGITQYNPSSNWGDTIAQVRPQLSAVPCAASPP